jgi:UDP-N-acetylmuramyl pentapeptide phosphotransferase/UDP-N-acetylglucosamine-1-phosphate transferase
MADAVTALIGAIIMIGYVYLIAIVLAAPPFWVAVFVGLGLMLWGFWVDDWRPLLRRKSE